MNVLLGGLHDPSVEVRFWAVFALGQARARKALPDLHRSAGEDFEVCPGWWTVSSEAWPWVEPELPVYEAIFSRSKVITTET